MTSLVKGYAHHHTVDSNSTCRKLFAVKSEYGHDYDPSEVVAAIVRDKAPNNS